MTDLEDEAPAGKEERDRFSSILYGLIAEYQNLATVIAGNDRVPADIRRAVTAHATGVMNELPGQLRKAVAASNPPACLHRCGRGPAHECTGGGEHSLTIVRPGGSEYRIRVCRGCYNAEAAKTAAA